MHKYKYKYNNCKSATVSPNIETGKCPKINNLYFFGSDRHVRLCVTQDTPLSFFIDANMLETMHQDTNANLYSMDTFLN